MKTTDRRSECQELGRRLLAAQLALWDVQTEIELRLYRGRELTFEFLGEWASMYESPLDASAGQLEEMMIDIISDERGTERGTERAKN